MGRGAHARWRVRALPGGCLVVALLQPVRLWCSFADRSASASSTQPVSDWQASRRGSLGGLGLALGGGRLAAPAAAARPKIGYQLQLPKDWGVLGQGGVPNLENLGFKELFLAASLSGKAEAKIVRVPLAVSPRDPTGLGGLATIEYFSFRQPRVTTEQIVDLLTAGYKSQPVIFSFALADKPVDSYKNETKYLRYDFVASRCEGAQLYTSSKDGEGTGKICQAVGTGETLTTVPRHHAIINTLYSEPIGGEKIGDGLLLKDGGAEVLWVLDISAPEESWSSLKPDVDKLIQSFYVGNETQLQEARAAMEAAPAA